MAGFQAQVHALRIEPHPNADRLELAAVGGFRSVVPKGTFRTGDLGAYIPEGAVCPEWLIEELGLVGKLAGKAANRVKAMKLRGVLSQGIVYPANGAAFEETPIAEGDVVTDLLGLVKWVPAIPDGWEGVVRPAPDATLKYDIEDIKRYPHALRAGEPVVMTEKLHGTSCCLGWHPAEGILVTSKGMSDQGLVFDLHAPNAERNVYVRTLREHEREFEIVRAAVAALRTREGAAQGPEPFYLLGEVHGRGVQDLHYVRRRVPQRRSAPDRRLRVRGLRLARVIGR